MATRIDATEAEREAFRETLRPLLTMDRRTFDFAEWKLYFEALRDIPPPLLQAAVIAMARAPRRFPFRPGDIRAAAEQARQALMAQHPYERCDESRHSGGFISIVDGRGVPRMARCSCFAEYRERMASLGVTEKPVLQLEAGSDEVSA